MNTCYDISKHTDGSSVKLGVFPWSFSHWCVCNEKHLMEICMLALLSSGHCLDKKKCLPHFLGATYWRWPMISHSQSYSYSHYYMNHNDYFTLNYGLWFTPYYYVTFDHTHFIFKSSAIIYEFEYIDRDIIKPLVLNQVLVFYPLINEEVPHKVFGYYFST